MFKMNRKGFTLIELTIVITILVILLAILVPNVLSYVSETDGLALEANAKTAYSAALQVSLQNSGKLSDDDSASIQEILGSGTVTISSNELTTDLGSDQVYILTNSEDIPIAAYFQKVSSRYPKN